MSRMREKFATQVDSALIADLRDLANREGRQIQALVDEAIETLLEQRRQAKPRPHVLAAHESSHALYGELYKKLAR